MNKRELGAAYEKRAVRLLQSEGVRVAEINFQCRYGEIDIIGYDAACLVFFEVKARRGGRAGSGAEAVDIRKQRKICRVADYYRMKHGIGDFAQIRYDCIIIDKEKESWIKNAFSHIW